MKPNLRLVNIKVNDIELMTEFYNELLTKTPDQIEEGRLVEYRFPGVLFGLYDPTSDSHSPTRFRRGTNCIPAFKLGSDYDAEKSRVSQLTDIVYEAEESGHRWFVLEDPEQNQVEMYQGSLD